MISERSPRWIRSLPSATYGCSWIVLTCISTAVCYFWLAQHVMGLQGVTGKLTGWLMTTAVLGPCLIVLSKSRLRRAAQRWSRQIDVEDARVQVRRLVDQYQLTRDKRKLASARRALARIRRRHRDEALGSDIDASIDAAEGCAPRDAQG